MHYKLRLKQVFEIRYSMLRKVIFFLFKNSLGKFVRIIQRTLIPNDAIKSVITIVNQNAILRSVNFAELNFKSAIIFSNRKELWTHCLNTSTLIHEDKSALILEFGVWKGESINFFAEAIPYSKVYGFDSFHGLEENWYGYSLAKNAFDLGGKLPKVRKNAELIPGWYSETLPTFMLNHSGATIGLIHLDSDTYTPTKFVLNRLKDSISKGTIIVFDEFFGYPNWELHEFLAWSEFVEENKLDFRYLGYTNMQVAVEVL
jgi:hypothetical protein